MQDSSGVSFNSAASWIKSFGNGESMITPLRANSTSTGVRENSRMPEFTTSVFSQPPRALTTPSPLFTNITTTLFTSSPPMNDITTTLFTSGPPMNNNITTFTSNPPMNNFATPLFTSGPSITTGLSPVEVKINVLETGTGLEDLINLSEEDITPEQRQSVIELYPFPEFQPSLADPITTVAVIQAVVQSDPVFLAQVIETRDDDAAVADGLKIPVEARKQWNARTPDRNDDGDVISIKGLALAGLEGRPPESLANIIILSLTDFNDSPINPFVKKVPVVRGYLEGVFNDTDYLAEVLLMDANVETPRYYTYGRKLLVAQGESVKAFPCAECFPMGVCKVCFWCDKSKNKNTDNKKKNGN